MSEQFLDLLYGDAPREAFDEVVARAVEEGLQGPGLERLREHHTVALRIREQRERQRQREAEMSALYETAGDLTAIRDVDAILAAIVRRARSLLHADMTYLSLNDEEDGASYMKVTDGALTPEFRRLRLPLGTGLLGLVAQTGEPYYTEDYRSDERFLHREFIDTAVEGEKIRAILGVPLTVEGTVIGALLAVHRNVRPFPPGEVSLLMSFAAHAAVALENARLFERIDTANRTVRAQAEAVEVAARAHDRLTDVLLHGGGVADVAAVVADVLHGHVLVVDGEGHRLAGVGDDALVEGIDDAVAEARASGRSVEVPGPAYVAVALAGTEHLGTLVLHGLADGLGNAARRTLERGALVTALVLLFNRTVAEAEDRVRGELLTDLLDQRDHDEHRLRERARRQHADLDGPTVVAVARVEGVERHRAAQVAARLGGEVQGLAGEHDGLVVLVAPRAGDAAGRRPRAARAAGRGRGHLHGGRRARRGRARHGRHRLRRGARLPRRPRHPRPGGRGQRPGRSRGGAAAAGPQRPRRARRVRREPGRPGAGLRRAPRHRARQHPGGLVRRRGPARRGGQAVARPPQHRRPAPRPDLHPARGRLAGPGAWPRRAAGPAAPPAARVRVTRAHGAARHRPPSVGA